ncbi:MAG: MFS transporter small subunit [Methylococcales bacterium]
MSKSKPFNPLDLLVLLLFWLVVSIPLAWGIWSTLQKAFTLFDQ